MQRCRAYLGVQRIANFLEQGDAVEYWKSAPYLFNFMDSYALKQSFEGSGLLPRSHLPAGSEGNQTAKVAGVLVSDNESNKGHGE